MKKREGLLGQGASWVKFRRRMFVALNKLNLLPTEMKEQVDQLRQLRTSYRLPEIARPKRQPIVVIKPVPAPTKRPGTFLVTPAWRDLRW